MKRLLLTSSALVALSVAWSAVGAAPVPTRLLRSPTVSANQVAFMYAENIWTVERSGGIARRITSFSGGPTNPKFSPDGK